MGSEYWAIMREKSLQHYGILGMKWGIRRTPEQLGHKTVGKKDRKDEKDETWKKVKELESRKMPEVNGLKWVKEDRQDEKIDPKTGLYLKNDKTASQQDDLENANPLWYIDEDDAGFDTIVAYGDLGYDCVDDFDISLAYELRRRGYDARANISRPFPGESKETNHTIDLLDVYYKNAQKKNIKQTELRAKETLQLLRHTDP